MHRKDSEQQNLQELREDLQRRRWHPRTAKKIGGVVAELLAKRGYARELSGVALSDHWQTAAGRLARHSRPGNLKRGVLEVIVKSSAALQELGFQKRRILKKLTQLAPEQNIRELKFYVGSID